ncbi:hypothetical protein SCATT_p00680 (plasmid) [Streptantibioticus cattleyicolor NRRL 8057 = DSM 46488]|uniref:Uncharacterized protein n=1 Tax=Streptantibioticus cattleyicolor (strain ATCC 35852 / DSM 46488 / JCM 4925 / NBRC 14057 / NRRL 8057) TaxID=1003195 RepID=F8JLL2_STREN|nr:hypothetical protein SCATT_p00680 [Streptantibioticus cattleyicolor NRRL 8057 = DSM 46488]CCB72676.1 exported protein of unknown function [Streptantibioticus cattleyicolor NRRL 8057 = DSM 46488]
MAALAGVIAGILALAVALTFWGPGSSSSTEVSPAPAASAPAARPGFTWSLRTADTGTFVGLWSTATSVVLGSKYGLTAYDAASGDRIWSWRPPGNGLLCNMSPDTSFGTGAFIYGVWAANPGIERCDHLQTVSLASGRLGWTRPVDLVGAGSTGFPDRLGGTSLSISGYVVTTPFAGSRTHDQRGTDLLSVDVRTGRVRWSTDFGPAGMPGGCRLSGPAQALVGMVYVLAECGDQARLFSLGDGPPSRPAGMIALPGCNSVRPYTAVRRSLSGFMTVRGSRLLVGCYLADPGGGSLYVLPAGTGRPVPLDTAGAATNTVAFASGVVYGPANLVLSSDTLYLVKGDNRANGRTDGVIAVDLATGRQRWNTTLPGASSVALTAATDSGVEVLTGTGDHASLHTVTRTGQVTPAPSWPTEQATSFRWDPHVNPPRAARTGDRLAIAFPGSYEPDRTSLGVLPLGVRRG